MIETSKFLSDHYESEVSNLPCLYKDHIQDPTRQRGHPKKLFKRRSRLDTLLIPIGIIEIGAVSQKEL